MFYSFATHPSGFVIFRPKLIQPICRKHTHTHNHHQPRTTLEHAQNKINMNLYLAGAGVFDTVVLSPPLPLLPIAAHSPTFDLAFYIEKWFHLVFDIDGRFVDLVFIFISQNTHTEHGAAPPPLNTIWEKSICFWTIFHLSVFIFETVRRRVTFSKELNWKKIIYFWKFQRQHFTTLTHSAWQM